MTKRPKHGTLSTSEISDKMMGLLGRNRVRVHPHANARMGLRGVIYFEILQALSRGVHEPRRDRFSSDQRSWKHSFFGITTDGKKLRIGVAFEVAPDSIERLLVITVIDLNK